MVCLKVGSLSGSLSVASNINLQNSKFAATAVNNTEVTNRETNHPYTNKALLISPKMRPNVVIFIFFTINKTFVLR